MIYPDTSFLCALYIAQSHSVRAIQFASRLTQPLLGTSLLFFEFRQSVQFQAFRFTRDRSQGYPPVAAKAAMAALPSDLAAGFFRVMQVDWPAVGSDITVTRAVTRASETLLRDTFNTHYLAWAAAYEYGPGTKLPPAGQTPCPRSTQTGLRTFQTGLDLQMPATR